MQLELAMHGHGGKRAGAGRPRSSRALPHGVRERIPAGAPVMVTLRVAMDVPTLRTAERFRVIAAAADLASRDDARIVHYSVQVDHLHILAEAKDAARLGKLMRRFQIRVARGLNALLGRHGPMFPDRYHARALPTPREVRSGLAYILNNRRHHVFDRTGESLPVDYVDPYSTAILFDGWQEEIAFAGTYADPTRAWPARSWLIRTGWRRHGPIPLAEIPARARRRAT